MDLATGIKECKDRITALEENRRLDLAQINEKWNVQMRRLNKTEKAVGMLQRNLNSKKQQPTIVKIVKGDVASGGGTGGANDQPEPFGKRRSTDDSNDEEQSNYDKFIGRSSHGS